MVHKLNWENTINILQYKLKSSVRKFYFLSKFCAEELLRTLFFGLVDSRLQNGVVCWGDAYIYLINKLEYSKTIFKDLFYFFIA